MPQETVHSSTALKLAAAILQELPQDIPQDVALWWIDNKTALSRVLRKALVPQVETVVPTEELRTSFLKPLCTIDVSAQEAFRAADFFKDKGQPDGIKFWLGDNFKNHFLKGLGKIKLYVLVATLNVYTLREVSVNGPILTALGGDNLAKTSLAYVAQLIKAQPQGQEGVLLTNGWANIFYIEDDNGELWAVGCYGYSGGGGWRVNAYPVADPSWWSADYQVFSPAVLIP